MYQSGRAGDEAKKRKSPAKSGRVGIYANLNNVAILLELITLMRCLKEYGGNDIFHLFAFY